MARSGVRVGAKDKGGKEREGEETLVGGGGGRGGRRGERDHIADRQQDKT